MATWRVVALAATGVDYVYRITAPSDAGQDEILDAVHTEHDRKLAAGEVAEPLGPWAIVSEIAETSPSPSVNDCE